MNRDAGARGSMNSIRWKHVTIRVQSAMCDSVQNAAPDMAMEMAEPLLADAKRLSPMQKSYRIRHRSATVGAHSISWARRRANAPATEPAGESGRFSGSDVTYSKPSALPQASILLHPD